MSSPEFQRALREAADEQWRSWLYGGGYVKAKREDVPKVLDEIKRAKEKAGEIKREAKSLRRRMKGRMARARAMAAARGITPVSFENMSPEEMREWGERQRREAEFRTNPQVKRIEEDLRERAVKVGLVCPECGDSDHGNRMNGRPWCLRCNVPLMEPSKVGKWVNVKVLKGGGLDEETLRKLRGLPDDGGVAK